MVTAGVARSVPSAVAVGLQGFEHEVEATSRTLKPVGGKGSPWHSPRPDGVATRSSADHDSLVASVIREESQSEALVLTAGDVGAEPAQPSAAPEKTAELTPFMRQWTAAKRENPDALLFFRMGDFYELFYDDAVVASRELQLTLTARDRERLVPMCGVPYHSVESYLTRLLRRGFRIAICEQMEDPKLTKKIVRREVTKVLSPGTALDSARGQEQNNFLAAYFETQIPSQADKNRAGARGDALCAIALLDLSTGEFRTAEFSGAAARQQAVDGILMAGASEVLVASSAERHAGL